MLQEIISIGHFQCAILDVSPSFFVDRTYPKEKELNVKRTLPSFLQNEIEHNHVDRFYLIIYWK